VDSGDAEIEVGVLVSAVGSNLVAKIPVTPKQQKIKDKVLRGAHIRTNLYKNLKK
jgi:hypothetical protein